MDGRSVPRLSALNIVDHYCLGLRDHALHIVTPAQQRVDIFDRTGVLSRLHEIEPQIARDDATPSTSCAVDRLDSNHDSNRDSNRDAN